MRQYEQSVFISYAWGGESEDIVNQIDQALQQRGLKIIRDKRDLGYKGSISTFMEQIGQGNCVIVVISDKYLRSSNCMFELVEISEGKQFHDRVFPIVLSDALIYDPVKRLKYVKHWEAKRAELAEAMKEVDPANLQGIREEIDLYDRIRDNVSGLTSILKDMNTLTPEKHRDSDFSEIYTGIKQRMAGASGQIKPESGESPYMGLRYFDTSDAELFYGREVLTRELTERVSKESFLAIVGASGSGKSSVARAGLIPSWKKENERSTVHVITPTEHPLESLAERLTSESESVTAASTLMEDLQKDTRSLRLYAKKMLSNSGKANLLLVVDQFEETFTLCEDLTERKAFIENLLSLAEENSASRVVITLRADFYHHCFDYEGLRLILQKHQANIGAMTQEELREAIVQPAEKNGWDFQPGLVDLILQDVGAEPGALPLLSHALLETWKRRQRHTLTLQGYQEAGGVQKAIAQTAESIYRKLSDKEQNIAHNIFVKLTASGEDIRDTRRRVKKKELLKISKKQVEVTKVLEILIFARLITADQDSFEVTHEALIRQWERLRKWLDENRESELLHIHLTKSAQEWQRRGREATELYRGARLQQIQAWMKTHASELSALEIEFVKASLKVKWREQLRLISFTMTGVALLLMVLLEATGKLNPFIYQPVDMKGYWATIPAGTFLMGSSDEEITKALKLCAACDFSNEQPQHWVDLPEYQIGKYEVTNRQYAQCVKAGFCQLISGLSNTEADKALHPLVNVNWDDAKKFCEWVGGRLPTEAEWEKAASWDAKTKTKRTYPWGQTIDCSHANYSGHNSCVRDTTPVGSYESGKSPYGLYDMAGNVLEWVNDWYGETYYQSSPSSNPQGPEAGDFRVVRGGAWSISDYGVRSASRVGYILSYTSSIIGFRCSRDSSP